MEHMQIVPRYHCHAKHKAWSFITPVISCTPPWAQTMNPGPSSMLLFVFNCQEKENKSPVTRRCKCAAVSCKAKRESLQHQGGNAACRPAVLTIDLSWPSLYAHAHTHTHEQPPLPFVFRWFCLQSILPLKSKWADCKRCVLHVERQEGA